MVLSPDRNKLAYVRNVGQYISEIRVYDFLKRSDNYLTRTKKTLFRIDWSANNTGLIYKNSENEIVEININTGKKKIKRKIEFSFYSPFRLDDIDRKYGVISGYLSNRNISALNLVTNESSSVIGSKFIDTLPTYNKKTESLAWISNRKNHFQIWLRNREGKISKVSNFDDKGRISSLSFNGKGTLLGGIYSGRWFVYNLIENELVISEQSDNTSYSNFSWNADSKTANIRLVTNTYSTLSLLDYEKRHISNHKIFPHADILKESPDGQYIYTWYQRTNELTKLNRQTGKTSTLSRNSELSHPNEWYIGENYFYWVERNKKGEATLKRTSHKDNGTVDIVRKNYSGPITGSKKTSEIIFIEITDGYSGLVKI